MPLLLLIVGVVLIVTAIRGSTPSLAMHLKQDFSGGFLIWIASIVAIGAIGYVPALRTISRLLLGLVITVILLKNGTGFLQSFVSQIENAPAPAPIQPVGGNANLPAIPIDSSSSSSSGSSGSGSTASTAASLAVLAL